MNKILPALIVLAGGLPDFKEPERRKDKCGLPECNNMTACGYCCVEHCKEHRWRMRAARHGRNKSKGFYGYDWMIDEIEEHGRIRPEGERCSNAPTHKGGSNAE